MAVAFPFDEPCFPVEHVGGVATQALGLWFADRAAPCAAVEDVLRDF